MIVENILTAGQIAGAIAAIIGAIVLVGKYVVQKPLDKRIIEVTKQIQPDANGGKSLADVALGIVRIERKVENVIKRVEKLEETIAK
jgi:hypothetical protein